MSILGAVIVPHPPLIIPTVGRGREQEVRATIDAYRTATEQVAAWEPEVLIVTSPHQVMYADYFHISPGRGATGDMSAFGAAQTKLRVEYDAPLRDEIIRCGEAVGLQVGTLGQRDPYLDHGTFVPLYFLREAGVNCPILRIGLSGFSPLDHYRLGECIAQAVEDLDRRTEEDIQKIADTYNAFADGTLEDVKGFCAAVPTEEIARQDYILTPGRYVGIEEQEDDGEPFEEKMGRLTSELSELFAKSHELEKEIRERLGEIGYEL